MTEIAAGTLVARIASIEDGRRAIKEAVAAALDSMSIECLHTKLG
jgi:hypothetical protein